MTWTARGIRLVKDATLVTAVSALMLTAWPATAQTNPETTRVVQLLRTHQYDAAQDAVNNLLATRPHDCQLLSLDGMALAGLGRPSAAKSSFDEALRYCPRDLLALEGAAQIAYAQKLPEGPELLRRILAIRPDDVTTNGMLASMERTPQTCKSALPHFEKSKPLFASHPQLQEGYAWCLAATGSNEAAASNYQQVLAAAASVTARYNLAVVQARMHDSGEALKTLHPLLGTDAEEAPLQLASQLAEDAGDTPQAVQLLRQAILRDPQNEDNYLRFAQLSFTHNSPQVGIDMLDAGLTQLPSGARLYLARGILNVQVSKFDDAFADFEKAHGLDPKLSLALDAIGITQSQQHNAEASLDLFREQAQQHPNDGLLQYLYAEALSQNQSASGSNPRAIEAAERSVQMDPGYVPGHDLLAALYLRAGQPNKAVLQAEMALKIDQDDKAAVYQEMMARRQLGETEEAQKLVQRLSELRQKSVQETQRSVYVLKDDVSQEMQELYSPNH